MYTGRILTGREAKEYGLVSRVVPDDQLLATALELAEEIVVNCAPVSVAITKSMIYQFLNENDLSKITRVNDEYLRWMGKQPEPREGVTSFLEKCPAD
jgi:enoyl-CoA hydratase/carnithine racemase